MKKIEHIGIALKNLEESNKLFASLFGKPHYKVEEIVSEGVKTSFFKNNPNKIELLKLPNRTALLQGLLRKKVKEFIILLLPLITS